MTAFEPPDFEYFPGLNFNPEIYENPLTETGTSTLPTNPTFTSVSTPIVYTDQIQRYTASIINLFNSPAVTAVYMGLASTLFNIGNVAIIGSNILPNGVGSIALGETAADTIIQALTCYIVADAAFELTSGASTKVRVEPTLAYIKAATTTIRDAASNILASFTSSAIGFTTALLEVVQGATTTMSLTEASTLFRNTTDWAVQAPATVIKDQLGTARLYVTSTFMDFVNPLIRIGAGAISCIPLSPATTFSFNFKTNTANDTITTSSIVASGGSTAGTGTLTTTALVQRLNTATLEVGNATPTAVNFKTNTAAPTTTTSSITASGGTTAGTGTMVIDADYLQLDTIQKATYDFETNGTTGIQRLTTGTNGTGLANFWEMGTATILIGGTGNWTYTGVNSFNSNAAPANAIYIIMANASNTLNSIYFADTNGRDGWRIIMYNQSAFTRTCQVASGNRFTGPGLARAGQTTCTIASNAARMFISVSNASTTAFASGLTCNIVTFVM